MKIYLAHSREFDYQHDLYDPIRRNSNLNQSDLIFPHEQSDSKTSQHDRQFYKDLDLVIAEVSFPATGLGIELAWCADAKVPIVCISRRDAHVSGSLRAVCSDFYQYSDADELSRLVENIIKHYKLGEYNVNQ